MLWWFNELRVCLGHTFPRDIVHHLWVSCSLWKGDTAFDLARFEEVSYCRELVLPLPYDAVWLDNRWFVVESISVASAEAVFPLLLVCSWDQWVIVEFDKVLLRNLVLSCFRVL